MSPRTKIQLEIARTENKDKILKAALQQFSTKGFFNTSVRQIAKEADISIGLLYNYYKNKDELAMAVLHSAFSSIDASITPTKNGSPKEKLTQAISQFIEMVQNQKDKIRLLAQMGIQKEKLKFLNDATIMKYKGSVEQFQKLLKENKIPNHKLEAELLVATLDGLVLETLLMDGGVDLGKMKENLIKKYCS